MACVTTCLMNMLINHDCRQIFALIKKSLRNYLNDILKRHKKREKSCVKNHNKVKYDKYKIFSDALTIKCHHFHSFTTNW